MAKTIDVSGWPTRVYYYLVSACFVFGGLFVGAVLCWRLLTALGVTVPFRDGLVWPAVFAVLWVALTVQWARTLLEADGDWWGPIPREQYLGRFAEGGGLARHSWEKAIDELPDGDENDRER